MRTSLCLTALLAVASQVVCFCPPWLLRSIASSSPKASSKLPRAVGRGFGGEEEKPAVCSSNSPSSCSRNVTTNRAAADASSISSSRGARRPPSPRPVVVSGKMSRRGAIGLAALIPAAALSMTTKGGGGGGGGRFVEPAVAAVEEFPWVARGGLYDDVLPQSVLVKSLPLNYKAIKSMGQSLDGINELRGLNVLRGGNNFCKDGQVEADLSFVTPPIPEAATLEGAVGSSSSSGPSSPPPSSSVSSSGDATMAAGGEQPVVMAEEEQLSFFRWAKIKGIADDVRNTFDKEKDALPFALTIRANTTQESQNRRRQRFADELKALDEAIANLQNATKRESIAETLYYQAQSLLHLGHLGELMVAKFPFAPPKADNKDNVDDYYNLPRLFGRAQVDFILRETNTSDPSRSSSVIGNVTIIVDGFNAPISAGNFVDLCQRGFYNKLPFRRDQLSVGKPKDKSSEVPPPGLDVLIGGTYKAGFVDPITGKQRRVPLEVMREEKDGVTTPFYGQARNTGLFTRAPPLLSFRTPHAVGLLHPEEDGNGANSEFFVLRDDPRCIDNAKALDGKYALVGYVVSGSEVLPRLNENCFIDSCAIKWGLDHFVRSRVSFIDILLQGEDR